MVSMPSLRPIGNVGARVGIMGASAMAPMPFPRSVPVPGGNAIVGEMELSVPQTVKIVDHAITRAFNKGVTAEIEVIGPPKLEVFKA